MPVDREERRRIVEHRELRADGRADRRPEHLASEHRLGVAVDGRAVVAGLTYAVERRMMHDQKARFGIDAQGAARQVGEQRGVVSEDDPGADRGIGIEEVGDPLVETAPDFRMERVRVFQNRPFELNKPGPIAGSGLSAQLLDDRGRGTAGEAEVANGDYVVTDA